MVQILSTTQVNQKIKRLAYQIFENHCDDTSIHLVGINNNGKFFAHLIMEELQKIADITIAFHHVTLNPAAPAQHPIELDVDIQTLEGKNLILIDDVANSGRTLFYAAKPFFDIVPKQLETAVLVDRSHKYFPISVDYVGLSLATTLSEHIEVNLQEERAVYLK